ncbi:MAG: transcription antitermination factor NusB [Clostridiales bacterium]|nr:transcription antitermination factor NusB [Clostridiales bacterium]
MSRIGARENLMQLVFGLNFKDVLEESEDLYLNKNLTEEDKEYIFSSLNGIKNNYNDIISLIEDNLVKYNLDRICKTDLAILIVSIYEIKYLNMPNKVVINEAVELAKKYSTENSYKFVNGLLARLVN